MKPNQKDQVSQPVENKLNQPTVQNVKKQEIKSEQAKVIQDNQYGAKQKNASSPNSEKIASADSKDEMETAAVEKDRAKKASDSASKVNTLKEKK